MRTSGGSKSPRRRWTALLWAGLVLGILLGPSAVRAADPSAAAVPAGPSTPGVPTVPSTPTGAASEAPAVLPGEGASGLPSGATDRPLIELIPPGLTPLQPANPLLPNTSLDGGTPLVPQTSQAVEEDAKKHKYKVSKFTVKYGPEDKPPHPGLPPAQTLADAAITLGESSEEEGGYVAPGTGARDVPVVLSKFTKAESFSGDAIQTLCLKLSTEVNKRGIYGVFVVPKAAQINLREGKDLRADGDTQLTLLIYASEVKQVRTIVKPVPKPPFKGVATTVADPKYDKIAKSSPLQGEIAPPKEVEAPSPASVAPVKTKAVPVRTAAAVPPAAAPVKVADNGRPGSLLRRADLQDYLDRVNRFPGRRVDVAVSASGDEGGVVLDYIVHAEKPAIFLFNQTSNTGTEASGTWRTRVGFELRQLAGLDDLLDASFETSLSSETYSAFGSYQVTPIFPDKLKLKVYGGYGRFLAEDVGFDLAAFKGDSATAGLLAIYTPYYFKGFPIDLLGGVEYKYVDITDVRGSQEGQTSFLLPYVGVSTDRATDLYNVFGNLQLQVNLPSVIGTENSELQQMGRLDVDRNFLIGRYAVGGSFFLEPIIFRKTWKAYEEEMDADKRKGYWKTVTTAHELSLFVHGQYTFGDHRLIPQFEDVIGGFVSVRGYPEAYTAGDDSVVLNAEYRFHLPRVLKPYDTDQKGEADPAKAPKFALHPPTILGRPDLDFIVRTFFDLGYVKNNNIQQSLEADRFLSSVGVGAEVQVSRYLNLRVDWGFPLTTVDDRKTSRPVTVGSSHVSFVGVITY